MSSLAAAWATAWEPPPELSISEWADECRQLPQTSAARGGRWRTASTPYLQGMMDAARDSTISKMAWMKCHQSGGSEGLNNIIGYFIQHDPCPILMVHPTGEAAETWSKERLADMIRSTPALGAVVYDKRQARGSHQAESTLKLKMYPGGFLATGGANTPNTFARWSVRLAIGDDVDRFPPVVADEGDPADLLVNRTTSFHDALTIFVSTPTLKGGRIDTLYSRSDQRRYFVACPDCGRRDWVTWNDGAHFRVVFDDEDAQSARIECPDGDHGGCGARIDEPTRRRIVAAGEWRPTREPDEPGLAGFHLPAMVSTLGSVTLTDLVGKWLSARARGKEALRVFINTSLAEGWEDRGIRMEPHVLMTRRESYGDGVEIPAAAPVLTAGVDVQVDRFEILVMAWGPAEERWVVDWRTVWGDPKLAQSRAALIEALSRRYTHELGLLLPIHATCIDSGYATDEVYDFVLRYRNRAGRIYATKGQAGRSGEPIIKRPSPRRHGDRLKPHLINVDDAKSDAMTSLQLTDGPRSMHFPAHIETVDEEFFAQLCAEHRETRYNKSKVATHEVWVQNRERNEALDCEVLAYAAFRELKPNIPATVRGGRCDRGQGRARRWPRR